MTIFHVHVPAEGLAAPAAADRVHFERQGFSIGAFLFGPLWLLVRGIWIAFVIWCLLALVVAVAAGFGYLSGGAVLGLAFVGALYLGLEGRNFADASLERAGWRFVDVAVGADRSAAERSFFSRWPAAPPPIPRPVGSPQPPHVIGLFPEAGG